MTSPHEFDWIGSESIDSPLSFRVDAFPIKGISRIEEEPYFGPSQVILFDWKRPRRLDLRPSLRVFERFLELETDDSIIAYANEFGALGLCGHGLPHHHPFLSALGVRNGRFLRSKQNPDSCLPLWQYHGKQVRYGESVVAWRVWARHARALVGVATKLYERKDAAESNLRLLTEPQAPFKALLDGYPEISSGFRDANGWGIVAWWTRAWLNLARVGITAGFSEKGSLSLELGAQSPLLGYLALSLGTAVTRTPGLAMCAACQQPFFPKRAQSERDSFCERCGVRAAQRLAAKRYRDRIKAGKES
jgi:hypothetical protein